MERRFLPRLKPWVSTPRFFMTINKMKPSSASILVTEDCNLRCKYCFEHHNKNYMDAKTAKEALLFLANGAVANGQDKFHAMIFGGEPLLNINAVEAILKYGVEIAEDYGIRFSANIITNATVMNDHIYSVLREYRDKVNLNIQLSVDGLPEVQDEYRVTATGKGSWELVEKNIPRFQALYNNDPTDIRLSIHGCINHKTLPKLYESYKFFKYKLHFKQIWFLAISEENWTEEDVIIYDSECRKIYNDICFELEGTQDISEADFYSPFDRYRFCGKAFSLPCSAGRDYVTITACGDVYPCHQIYFNDPEHTTKIGDIYNGVDDDKRRMFLEYKPTDIYGCEGCKNTNCYRCLAANWMKNGSVLGSITGMRCKMSSVENKYQQLLKDKVDAMSLKKKAESLKAECLCNMREGNIPVLLEQKNCQSGNNPDNPDCLCDVRTNDDAVIKERTALDDITDALVIIIQKLENIEKRLELNTQ